jgi:hypothetical protein
LYPQILIILQSPSPLVFFIHYKTADAGLHPIFQIGKIKFKIKDKCPATFW